MASEVCFSAISISDWTFASFASLAACACAMAISLSACALATAAPFLICDILSIPKSSMTLFWSANDCTLKEIISSPIFCKSGIAFSWTRSPNALRSVTISSKRIWPTISRIFPSRVSWTRLIIIFSSSFKKNFEARAIISWLCPIRILTVASTLTLIYSAFGT